eukprot:4433290-Lingulodinium_polyedra.AAC.1
MARAWSARVCDSRTAAAADGRCDRIVAQRFTSVTQRCGRIDRPRPQRLANRTLAYSMRAPKKLVRAW